MSNFSKRVTSKWERMKRTISKGGNATLLVALVTTPLYIWGHVTQQENNKEDWMRNLMKAKITEQKDVQSNIYAAFSDIRDFRKGEFLYCSEHTYTEDKKTFIKKQDHLTYAITKFSSQLKNNFSHEMYEEILGFLSTIEKDLDICSKDALTDEDVRGIQNKIRDDMGKEIQENNEILHKLII